MTPGRVATTRRINPGEVLCSVHARNPRQLGPSTKTVNEDRPHALSAKTPRGKDRTKKWRGGNQRNRKRRLGQTEGLIWNSGTQERREDSKALNAKTLRGNDRKRSGAWSPIPEFLSSTLLLPSASLRFELGGLDRSTARTVKNPHAWPHSWVDPRVLRFSSGADSGLLIFAPPLF